MDRRWSVAALSMATAAAATACGVGAGGGAVQPPPHTVKDAAGEACPIATSYGEPLIVDWRAQDRADLEEAMASGIAVVSYDCKTLRLLKECRIDGAYGLLGVSKKEELIELEDADEIRANLPTFGGKLALDLEGDLARGSSLDLAMVLVAKKRTTVAAAGRPQLRGRCDGATHFVRGAFLGAFALGVAARGRVRAAAQLFGVGSEASSASARNVTTRDGDPEACEALPQAPTSIPPECSALLRLELQPIGAAAQAGGAPGGASCPAGTVLVGDKCAQPSASGPRLCNGAVEDCSRQCESGSARSCWYAGQGYLQGRGTTRDPRRAASFFADACTHGEPAGCTSFGIILAQGEGVPQDEEHAREVFGLACDEGESSGCANLGKMMLEGRGGPKDDAGAVKVSRRACDGGTAAACWRLGAYYDRPKHPSAQDAARSAEFYRRACDGGVTTACTRLAQLHEIGRGVAVDRDLAIMLYRRACARARDVFACTRLREMGAGATP